MIQICHCGTQPGYPHDAACPFPLYTDDNASVEKWARERAAVLRDLTDRVRGGDTAAALAALVVIDNVRAKLDEPACVVCDGHGCEFCPKQQGDTIGGPLDPDWPGEQGYASRGEPCSWDAFDAPLGVPTYPDAA